MNTTKETMNNFSYLKTSKKANQTLGHTSQSIGLISFGCLSPKKNYFWLHSVPTEYQIYSNIFIKFEEISFYINFTLSFSIKRYYGVNIFFLLFFWLLFIVLLFVCLSKKKNWKMFHYYRKHFQAYWFCW